MGQILSGHGAPAADLGEAGDAYVDVDTYLFYLPKSEGSGGGSGGGATCEPYGFFGLNTHASAGYEPYASMTTQDYLDLAQELGLQLIRTNIHTPDIAAAQAEMFDVWAAKHIVPFIVVDQGVDMGATYDENYDKAYNLAVSIAAPLQGHAPKLFEWSNEMDIHCRTTSPNPIDGCTVDGSVYYDYDDAKFDAWRGWVAGGVAGITSLIPDAQVSFACGSSYVNILCDMMKNGLDSQGNPTRPPIPIGFAGMHWYDSMHDPENAGSWHYPEMTNILQEIADLGLPIYVSEWGAWQDEDGQAAYMERQYPVWINGREKYGIRGVMHYTLFADERDSGTEDPLIHGVCATNFGLIQADGKTQKKSYFTMQTCHAENTYYEPDSGSSGGAWPKPRALVEPVYYVQD
jgi:hypothetical protein